MYLVKLNEVPYFESAAAMVAWAKNFIDQNPNAAEMIRAAKTDKKARHDLCIIPITLHNPEVDIMNIFEEAWPMMAGFQGITGGLSFADSVETLSSLLMNGYIAMDTDRAVQDNHEAMLYLLAYAGAVSYTMAWNRLVDESIHWSAIVNEDSSPLVVLPELLDIPDCATAVEALAWVKNLSNKNPEFAEAVASLVLVNKNPSVLRNAVIASLSALNPGVNIPDVLKFINKISGIEADLIAVELTSRYNPEVRKDFSADDILTVAFCVGAYSITKAWNDFMQSEDSAD